VSIPYCSIGAQSSIAGLGAGPSGDAIVLDRYDDAQRARGRRAQSHAGEAMQNLPNKQMAAWLSAVLAAKVVRREVRLPRLRRVASHSANQFLERHPAAQNGIKVIMVEQQERSLGSAGLAHSHGRIA